MFIKHFCQKEALRYYIQEIIKSDKLTVEEKTYYILNARKTIKKKAKELKKHLTQQQLRLNQALPDQ